MDEEYEILPKDEIEELRREVKKIQKNPFGDTKQSKTLLDSMESLTTAINKLLTLFEKTHKDIVEEYEKNKPAEALNEILDQNEKIAKGTLAVADLIQDQKEDLEDIKNAVLNSKVASDTPTSPPIDNKIPDMGAPFGQESNLTPPPFPPQNNQQSGIPKQKKNSFK